MRLFIAALLLNFMLSFNKIEEASGLLRRLKSEKSGSKKEKNKIDEPATSTLMPPPAPKHNPIQDDVYRSHQEIPSAEMSELFKRFSLSKGEHQERENIDWLIQETRKMTHSQGVQPTTMIPNDRMQQQEKEYLHRENIDWLIQHTLHRDPSYGASSTMMIQGDHLQQHDQLQQHNQIQQHNQLQQHNQRYSGYENIHGSIHHFDELAHPAHQFSTGIPELSEQGAAYSQMETRSNSEEAKSKEIEMDETGKFRVPRSKKHSRFNEQSHSSHHDPQPQKRRISENAVWREVPSKSRGQVNGQYQHSEHASQGHKTDLIQNQMNAYFNPYHEYQPRDPGSGSQH